MSPKELLFVVIPAILLSVISCSSQPEQLNTKVYTGIDRVFMHSVFHWSFIQDDYPRPIDFHVAKETLNILKDVAPQDKCWIKVKVSENFDINDNYCWAYALEIHLHSVKDINGAGWDLGKSGQGQTQVIE